MMRLLLPFAALAFAAPALGDCVFDANFEITNPFDASCGGVIRTYTEDNNVGTNIALGYPVPRPVDSLTAVDGFRSYASLLARHQDLWLTNPDALRGSIVGQTIGGRDIWAYRLGDSDSSTIDGRPEPAVMLNGAIHAREWQSPEAATEVFEQLIELQDDVGLGRYLHENLNVVILPVLNVDGFLQTQMFPETVTADVQQPRDGRMRRKNLRNPVNGSALDASLATVADNFWGVDLNRNSAEGFAQNAGSSSSVTSLVYHGAAPASEPEILALQAAAALGPVNRMRLYGDLHSFSQIFFTPQTGDARRDAVTGQLVAALRAVLGGKYRFGPELPGGGGIGTTADYFAYRFGIPAWTHELEPLDSGAQYGGTGVSHSGFILPDSEVARMRDEIARTYLLGFYRQAGPPRVVAIEIRETESNTVSYRADWVADGADARSLDVSANSALVPGGSYRLWLAFDKPMRFRDANNLIVAYPGQQTDASTGSATLELQDAGGTDVVIPVGNGDVWLDTPGGAPNGYLRYVDDALSAAFTIPAGVAAATPTAAVLAIDNRDFAGLRLDADTSTPVDFAGGRWTAYENARGTAGDEGGEDCSAKPFIAEDPNATPPAGTVTCSAAEAPAPPPPPPPPPSGSGGGGGAIGWLFCLLLAAWRSRFDRVSHCERLVTRPATRRLSFARRLW
ncbi:MAG: hypothetical protein H0W33_02820 [Gammaproteobacteria bacterium]|nr:hypothetical protein [Gammaproteobacteria bacterium]